ncbi:MAG: hypothetical protein MZV63_20705 [Marinilabiliales bacterium]|nr:hypothetical protein [Marinilabiliales bacterium]
MKCELAGGKDEWLVKDDVFRGDRTAMGSFLASGAAQVTHPLYYPATGIAGELYAVKYRGWLHHAVSDHLPQSGSMPTRLASKPE